MYRELMVNSQRKKNFFIIQILLVAKYNPYSELSKFYKIFYFKADLLISKINLGIMIVILI